MDINAYPVGAKVSGIQTYSDFENSECQLVYMCMDSVYVEIYCKNDAVLRQIKGNCEKNKFAVAQIEYEDAAKRRLAAF